MPRGSLPARPSDLKLNIAVTEVGHLSYTGVLPV